MVRILKMTPRLGASVLLALLMMAPAASEEAPVTPKAYHAKTYPACDAHEQEKLAIAADPYDLPDKARVFVVDYRKEGFLPVHFILSNDSDGIVSLAEMKVELITVRRVKLTPATPNDIYRRLAQQKRRGDEPSRNPLPIPLPRRKVPANVKPEAVEEVERLNFLAKAVEPRSTRAGFLFFDVEGIPNPLAGARLYVSGLRNEKGEELFFFEIPMEKYLSYQPGAAKAQ
ncbi:MAG TPA: hypothetical protein VNK82_13230 [Terriglobales bacterium]|nr:hypothetical protein [Terriglobales bacterium]